ncbi:MAG: hypothetical protein EZS28_038062, partial [Streblomastix strix]
MQAQYYTPVMDRGPLGVGRGFSPGFSPIQNSEQSPVSIGDLDINNEQVNDAENFSQTGISRKSTNESNGSQSRKQRSTPHSTHLGAQQSRSAHKSYLPSLSSFVQTQVTPQIKGNSLNKQKAGSKRQSSSDKISRTRKAKQQSPSDTDES